MRDALTVFDENGAVLHAPPPLWEALLARDWRRLFVDCAAVGEARLLVFGHALLEKLVAPRKDHDGPCLALRLRRSDQPGRRLAGAQLRAEPGGQAFTPLPVLGVPGWCAGKRELFLL